jgi:2,5-diamino-6-(ribosylamino)-4(3H)-pyrimidinone 5'-phosphate reductase
MQPQNKPRASLPRLRPKKKLPFVFVNIAITADGKIAPANRHFVPFTSKRDQTNLLELRTEADAVMSGARTVDLTGVTLGTGGEKYRRKRVKKGLAEQPIRVVPSGSGTLDPNAEIFKRGSAPLIILTTQRGERRLSKVRELADEVKSFGKDRLDFLAAFRWLREKWNVKRLLCEGGGEINAALFEADLVDELHLTISPTTILGGRNAPTLSDGNGISNLADAKKFRIHSKRRIGDELFLVYRRQQPKT